MRSRLVLFGMIVAVAHVFACEGMDPVAPSIGDPGAVSPAGAPVIVQVSTIGEFPGSGSGISGEATLTRTKDGVSVDQTFHGLTIGNAYTIWWVIFDNPQGCAAEECVPSDLGRGQAQGTLVNGGGFVADNATESNSSQLARHDVEGRQVWVGDPSGIDNPYRAQVHLVLRNHGVAESVPSDLAAQTSTFADFCNLLVIGCQNITAAVFDRPDAPGQGS